MPRDLATTGKPQQTTDVSLSLRVAAVGVPEHRWVVGITVTSVVGVLVVAAADPGAAG